jgi:phosphoribosyl 1,2-cyclic phosphate phosphodiesterase
LTLRFTILGCASSPGVPKINGDWGNCDSENPKNRRLRCSLLIEKISDTGTTTIVIDTSPDFREQIIAAGVKRLDAVVYTHSHADHIHGIDDLRGFSLIQKQRIPIFSDEVTYQRLFEAFQYCFETPPGSMYPPIAEQHTIRIGEIFSIHGPGGAVELLPVMQIHGNMPSLGFRVGGDLQSRTGGLCYSPDISDLPPDSIVDIGNLDVWIVDALQYRPHVSHFSLSESLQWIERIKPKRAILTHMHIPLDYERVMQETPENVVPGYDGLVIEIP